jgi:hypothetical protein
MMPADKVGESREIELATKGTPQNGHDRLAEALATLVQNQATLVQTQAAFVGRLAESDRIRAEAERASAERFARIEKELVAIHRVLAEHSRLLERLPEAVRDKIGFNGRE